MNILSSDNPQGARIRAEARGSEDGGEFVMYWMATALRTEENPALEVALTLAEQRGLPLLVYQPLFAQAWHATDRSHAFILEGIPDLARSLAGRGIRHVVQIVNSRTEDPPEVVARLASRAAVVVSEDFPCGPYPFWRREVAEGAARTLYVVDTCCILPMQLVGKAYDRAFAFRNSTATRRNRWVDQEVARAGQVPAWQGDPGFTPVTVRHEDIPAIGHPFGDGNRPCRRSRSRFEGRGAPGA